MFYSQFILAKKGPLGTIWIAAHLERKLRKNQVADTDIGVSVDSIIFPDVPIALRLSSHLMLGVVRIYSRKVNYLFHDCSEALLKVKQAFRSTAVDLPPEESTAPYHSITLPETFHLDDFELPEAAFQGDIDHHISTKEQITLQDNPEKTGYSTSQFGLDERFDDGSSSHIGLDFDEELMLNKDHSINLESDDGIIIQGRPSVPSNDMDVDDNQSKDEITEGYINMEDEPSSHGKLGPSNADQGNNFPNWNGYNVQTPDLNDMLLNNDNIAGPSASYYQPSPFPCDEPASPEFVSAQAPATPGLMEETVPSRVHGSPVLSPQRKASPSSNGETTKADASAAAASDFHHTTSANASDIGAEMTEQALAKLVQVESSAVVQDIDSLREQCTSEDLPLQCENSNLEAAGDKLAISADDKAASGETITANAATEDLPLAENGSEPSVMENPAQINEPSVNAQVDNMHAPDTVVLSTDFQQQNQAMQQDGASNDRPNKQSTSEFAEPEKMLSAPDTEFNQANDLGQVTAEKGITESDGSNKIGSLTSRKRHLEDSLPALEGETTERLSSRCSTKTADFVPDDDDLLASILVGRRTPGLTLGSTPQPPRVSSLKRPRLGSKIATLKRKVQLDDAMVLHADTIRQQLINTEDIQRIRKKAPCTRSEIWMIEKGSLEDDIFLEPTFSCLSEELNNLHNRTYETVELQVQPNMCETIAEDSNNVGTSGGKSIAIAATDDLLHIPEGTHSDVVQPQTNDVAGATAVFGLEISPDNQVNGVSNDFVADTVYQGVGEPLDDTEKEMLLADGTHAQVDTLDGDQLQDVPSDMQRSTDAKVSISDVICSGQDCTQAVDNMTGDFNIFVHNDVNVIHNNQIPTSEINGVEFNQVFAGIAQPMEDENTLSAMGDNSGLQENNMGSLIDMDMVHDDGLKECNDFGSAIHGVDTDFLNYDDDGDYDDANNDDPNPDEFQSLDNSGWSSRTRGVAKYLKTLFDVESGLGRKSVAIDRLLNGKTRKEASRMFFETLVLTTKDFINVEQPKPFDFVSVKPGPKLLKSDF